MQDQVDQENSLYGSKTALRIGDYVILKLAKPEDGCLSSPGLLDDSCFASTDADHFENCIWEIHVQNQYSAAKEFKEALIESIKNAVLQGDDENADVNKSKKSVQMEKEHLNQLRRAALNEQRLNEKLMGLRKGKPIAFGDPIQLRHVKSQKFLTVSAEALAKEERENLKVYLDGTGDSLSCLGFMPRYRFDKEGHVLTNNSEILIRVHERGGEYLHAAKGSDFPLKSSDNSATNSSSVASPVKSSEVNCSLEVSYWTIVLYQRVEDLKGTTITAGQLVTLQDPDSLSCLTVDRHTVRGEKPKIIMSPQFQLRDLRPGSTTVGTHLMWFLEKSDVTIGGPIALESDEVTLRDLNSGLYMRLDPESGLTAVRHRLDASLFEFRAVQSGKLLSSSFLQDESTVHLTSSDNWVSYSNNGNSCEANVSKGRAISLSVSSVLFKRLGVHLHVGVQACFILKTLLKNSSDYEHRRSNVDVHELTKSLRVAYGALDNLAQFLDYTEEAQTDDFSGLVTTDKDLLSFRQHMLREQGVIDVVMDLLLLTERTVLDCIQNPLMSRISQKSVKKLTNSNSVAKKEEDELDKGAPVGENKTKPVPNSLNVLANNARRRGSFQLLPSIGFGAAGNTISSSQSQQRNSFRINAALAAAGSTTVGDNANILNFNSASTRAPMDHRSSFNLVNNSNSPLAIARRISNTIRLNHPDLILSDNSDGDDEEDDEDLCYSNDAHMKDHKSASQHLAHRCLKVLLAVITNNAKNQLYVADRFPVLLSQVQEHRLAVLCVEELLKENLNILQTKVRQREIDIFVELLAQYEMSVTFLRLLQSTCSCPMGVDATQRMVTHALFGFPNLLDESNILRLKVMPNTSNDQIRESISVRFSSRPQGPDRFKEELSTKQKLVIKIHADRRKLTPAEWKNISLYCPRANLDEVVIGYSELKHGLPELWVSWIMTGKDDEFSMHTLFGYKDKVPLAAVCASMRRNSVKTKVKQRAMSTSASSLSKALRRKAQVYQKKQSAGRNVIVSTGRNRAQVADYFITQLYLVADLCLDRNYVAMIILESMYPYDVMVAMLKTSGISGPMKAAVCRIIRCLYVDREPQVETKFPRLIRTSLALAGPSPEARKSSEDVQQLANSHDQYKFALLQLLISEYIEEKLDLHYCDEMSAEVLDLLQALVRFSFYRTVPQILDILKPLLRVLDEKKNSKHGTFSSPLEGDSRKGSKLPSFFSFQWLRSFPAIYFGSNTNQVSPLAGSRQEPISSQNVESSDLPKQSESFLSLTEKWARTCQRISESLLWLTVVMLVVFASVAMAIVQLFTDDTFIEFFFATTIFFFVEIVFRYLVYTAIHEGKYSAFFLDFFNNLDTLLVCLDIELLVVTLITNVQPETTTRSLRISRLLRVLRLLRTIRLIRKVSLNQIHQKAVWKMPKRYLSVKKFEAKTMISMLQILSMFYDRIQDQTLDIAIEAFSFWYQEVKADRFCNPLATFEKLISVEESITPDLSLKFDTVILDSLMYSDVELTKEAVRLLMVHKSQRDLFFEVAESIQIVYSPKVAKMCQTLSSMISELQRLAEMFEIWSDLDTPADLEKAHRVKEILQTTFQFVGRKNDNDKTLGMRSLILADEEVQNILRNLDAMTVFITLQEALYDGGREELKPMIREILKDCNELICLFVKNSEVNQTVAFQYFSWFIDRISDDIDSSKVVRSVLEGNKDLIKKCPRYYLSEFARKITSEGQKPEFLDLFVGMTENSALYGSRVLSIESEICGYLTAREWKKYILLWCGSKDSQEYQERRLEMERCASIPLKSNGSADETTGAFSASVSTAAVVLDENLTAPLQYHLRILILLANCNLGPRLHAIYPMNDIIAGILDRHTVFPIKRELCRLLICVLKVSIDRAERSDHFWELLNVIIRDLDSLPLEIPVLSRSSNTLLRMQRGEWMELCAGIVSTFFERFEVESFAADLKLDQNSNQYPAPLGSPQHLRSNSTSYSHRAAAVDPRISMQKLYKSIRNLVDCHAGKLGHALTEELNYASAMIIRQLDQDSQHGDETDIDTVGTKLQILRMQHQRNSVVFADVQQTLYRRQFATFLQILKQQSKDSKDDIINFFRSIPRISDNISQSDVRFEPLVKKLTTHFRSMINKTDRSLDPSSRETCSWIIKSFRYMVEAELHFTCDAIYDIDDFDDSKVKEESEELKTLRTIFNENGVLNLCMDLIAVGIDQSIYFEAMKLLIALLFDAGEGVLPLQQTIYRYLVGTDSFLFFELLKEMIDNLRAFSSKENEAINERPPMEKSAIKSIPEDVLVFYLLQGLCGRSFVPIRDQLREQRGNNKLVNLFELIASYLGLLSRTESICNAFLAKTVLKTVLRLVQGPCRGNQDQFVLHSELLISLNRIIRDTRPSHTKAAASNQQASDLMFYQEKLKETVIDVIRALIEGHYESSLVFDRVATTIDVNVLHFLVFSQHDLSVISSESAALNMTTTMSNKAEGGSEAADGVIVQDIHASSTLSNAQAKYLVLVKHLSKVVDAFQGEHLAVVKDEITSVEVVFEQQVHVVYFHIPDFIKDIGIESKNRLIEEVKNNATGSRELMLMDFVRQCRKLYQESTHQQFLKKYGFAHLWMVKYYLTRFMFANAIVLNALVLLYYGTESNGIDYYAASNEHHDDHYDNNSSYNSGHRFLAASGGSATTTKEPDHLYLAPIAKAPVLALSSLQALCALLTVIIFAVVRIPVKFSSQLETTSNAYMSALIAVFDPLVLWYCGYLTIAVLALELNPLFVTVFLLDYVVLDSTSQDLLSAVLYPARQLAATLVMIFVALNIFTFSTFVLFRHDIVTVPIHTLWDTLKLCISYGFRGEYGVDHEMEPTIQNRLVQDVIFYFLVLSILRHIFFAIIVDTFGKLREEKFERESEAKNLCFICGIDRHDYDRMNVDFTFNDHRNLSHNPLNYMYFIMSIWHQSPTKDTSLEIHVRRCLKQGDVHWFPTGVLHEIPLIDEQNKRLDEGGFFEDPSENLKTTTLATVHHEGSGGGHHHGHGSGGHGNSAQHKGHNNSPNHLESKGGPSLLGRQHSILRKSAIFSHSNGDSPMNELMEKMNTMQKQILKLSKDVNSGVGRDRLNSHLLDRNDSATAVLPPPNFTSSPGSLQQTRRTAIIPDQKTPFQPLLHRNSSDDVLSDNTYSSTESDEEEEEEEEEEERGEQNEELKEENRGVVGEIVATNYTNKDRESPLMLGKSPGSARKSGLKRLTERSGMTSQSSRVKRSQRQSESNKQLQEKVNHIEEAIQLLIKKFEVMERYWVNDENVGSIKDGEELERGKRYRPQQRQRIQKKLTRPGSTNAVSQSLDRFPTLRQPPFSDVSDSNYDSPFSPSRAQPQAAPQGNRNRSRKANGEQDIKKPRFPGPPKSLVSNLCMESDAADKKKETH